VRLDALVNMDKQAEAKEFKNKAILVAFVFAVVVFAVFIFLAANI
jgi:hypothetical protein